MIYGCIGEHLPHSFSAEIHRMIGTVPYELKEIAPEDLDAFMRAKDFQGINVTIPYKQAVIPWLDEISETAREIGAVNTVVKRKGKLYGTNTDAAGLTALLRRTGLRLSGKKVLIAGTGGTSKTALYVANRLGAREVLRLSRHPERFQGEDVLSYEAAAERHRNAEILINTTPCGMFPHAEEQPLDPGDFPALEGVADVIYNPLRTRLVMEARKRGIPAEGGLYMLTAQAVRAAEVFRDREEKEELIADIYRRLLRQKENIVLIGMPGCGKSSVASELVKLLGREAVDTDRLIAERAGCSIPEIFRLKGEKAFRDLESEVIAEVSLRSGIIIATGGGAVLREENTERLKRNGRLFWLDRSPEALVPTADRPLADTREKMTTLYREREPVYRKAADERISVSGAPEEAAADIKGRWEA